ncbi:MAG: hypothetical protein R3F59_14050 [Myxococcota bacterium]
MGATDGGGLEWPLGIALGLLLVVLVNAGFAWMAVQHAPEVERSYTTAEHR